MRGDALKIDAERALGNLAHPSIHCCLLWQLVDARSTFVVHANIFDRLFTHLEITPH